MAAAIKIFALGSFGQTLTAVITDDNLVSDSNPTGIVDVSAATSPQYIFRTPGPDGQTIAVTVTATGSGLTSKFTYTIPATLFDPANKRLCGTWTWQPDFVLGAWSGATSEAGQFKVVDRLKRP